MLFWNWFRLLPTLEHWVTSSAFILHGPTKWSWLYSDSPPNHLPTTPCTQSQLAAWLGPATGQDVWRWAPVHTMAEPPLESITFQPRQPSQGPHCGSLSSLGSFAGLSSNCLVIKSLQWEDQTMGAHSPSTVISLQQGDKQPTWGLQGEKETWMIWFLLSLLHFWAYGEGTVKWHHHLLKQVFLTSWSS